MERYSLLKRGSGFLVFIISLLLFTFYLFPNLSYGADRLVVKDDVGETSFVVTEDGRIGVGTPTPGQDLDVVAPDNGLIRFSNTVADSTTKASRMVLRHYLNAQLPVYLFGAASTPTNNFVAFGGGANIGNAATQLDLYTAENTTTPIGSPRITIKSNGYVGIGTQAPAHPLQMASGAYVTTGGVWTNASSREYKENIKGLKLEDAMETLQGLNPITFNYKALPDEGHLGFIAEEVPELVATKDRKGLSPMDIVAVLTKVLQEQQKVVQEQQKTIEDQQRIAKEQQRSIQELSMKVMELEKELRVRDSVVRVDSPK